MLATHGAGGFSQLMAELTTAVKLPPLPGRAAWKDTPSTRWMSSSTLAEFLRTPRTAVLEALVDPDEKPALPQELA